ncbi:hypothetical protein [Pseudobacillus wudalianchiensis]|uniref:Uncharacterized protein n=1 Tax=Pseudobacillus wudalianchiensis TaxID=1743143 RepID=A0A1B9B923_9BACI|nr:hypothetical protein [Bacillus wudalianchiensis]OCA92581.1 hypothetical protein A8F95_02475 [Bacillus wudalianchiensis]
MNKELEEIIIKAFFVKRVQERVLFELASPKRRLDALSRLCHNYNTTLREQYMFKIPKPNSDKTEIEALLKKHGAEKLCYIISWNEEIDGQQMPLLSALENVVGFGMPSIISCIPGKLAYFESEQGYGPPPRYFLKKE